MTFNDQDARALIYLTHRLRKETYGANSWDGRGVEKIIFRLVGQNLATTIERVIAHAADPDAKTPGAINRPFLPAKQPPSGQGSPKRGEDCPRHAGQWPANCSGCATDRALGMPPPSRHAADPTTATEALTAARTAIANAKGEPA